MAGEIWTPEKKRWKHLELEFIHEEQTPGEALQWLDEALKWYNWNNLELRKEKMKNLEPRVLMNLRNKELITWMKQEQELCYAYPSPI